MKRLIDVFLNDISLTSVHDKILAVRVLEQPQADELNFETAGNLPGQRILSKKRAGLNLTVFLKVRELYDMNVRMDVINAVNAWAAKGGALKVSYRGAQTLNVVLSQPASPGDIRDYNTELELVFAADGWPYWKSGSSTRRQFAGASISTNMTIEGSAPSLMDAAIYVIKPITYLTLTVDDTTVELTNIDIPSGGYITLTHDDSGIMSIQYAGESIYHKLSDTSGDCLITNGGSARISYACDGDAEVTLSTLGRYM